MKKIIIVITLMLFTQWIKANSVTIKLYNNSNASISCTDLKIHNGSFLIKDYGNPLYKKVFAPGTYAELNTGTADALCGTDGYLEFQAQVNNKIYQIFISFDNPFIGTNEFSASATHPFQIKHLNGGPGSNMVISFDLTGGPSPNPPQPPPPPILIPSSGNKIITGYFTWDENITGFPEDKNLSNAFEITARGPSQLIRNNEGSGNDSYQDYTGWFSDIKEFKNLNITYTDTRDLPSAKLNSSPNIYSSKRTIRYQIHNMPDGIPIDIQVNLSNSKWENGKNAPESRIKPAQWIVFLKEKSRKEFAINYEIFGVWFDAAGNYTDNGMNGIKKEFLVNLKNLKPQTDFGGNNDYRKKTLVKPTESIDKTPVKNESKSIERQNIDIRQQQNIKKTNRTL